MFPDTAPNDVFLSEGTNTGLSEVDLGDYRRTEWDVEFELQESVQY